MIALQAGAVILQAPTNVGVASRAEIQLKVMQLAVQRSQAVTHKQEREQRSLRLLASMINAC